MQFDWDDSNEQHIALHKVSKAETEEALLDPFAVLFDSDVVDGEVRYSNIGATLKGRLLIVVFTIRSVAMRPITAFDSDRYRARLYREEQR